MKAFFPIFKKSPNLVYLDNAATTQKPQSVIDTIVEFYSEYNSNVHRGLYPISERATDRYEEARKKVAEFINASPEEIIFTSGTTDSINSLATSLVISNILKAPKVLLSELEHHSNLIPWQQILDAELSFITVDDNYQLGGIESTKENSSESWISEFSKKFGKAPDIVTLTHTSNVTGTVLDTTLLNQFKNRSLVVVDCAQSIAHQKIDVKKMNVDFLAFSGHKMYGPTGIGVLYGKKELLEKMQPFRTGGGMISEVTKRKSTWANLAEKFEAGTPNIAGSIGLASAIDFINKVGFEKISKIEKELRNYCIKRLEEIDEIKIFHPPLNIDAAGVISFSINGIHPHDLADFLGKRDICIRAGHHCTQVLHRDVFKVAASARVSFGIYNTKEDVDRFIEAVKEALNIFK